VVVVLVGAALVGVVAPSAGQQTTSEYSHDQLKSYGTHGGGPPSMRWLSAYGSATLRYDPAGLGSAPWAYVNPGQTVNDDSLTLRTVRSAPASEIDETLNMTIVSWQEGSRTVTTENGSSYQEPVAENISTFRQQVTLERGYDNATINLPAHYDEPWQVTVWVEEYPDAQWRFTHRSVETSRAIPFDDWGGLWSFALTNLLLPILGLTGAVSIGVPSSLRTTARGPKLGLFKWAIVTVVVAGLTLGTGYLFTTSVLATAPWVVAALVATIIGIVMLETIEYGTYNVVLARFFHDDSSNPRGDLAANANGAEWDTVTFANVDDGIIVLRNGLEAWLARLWGGAAYVKGLDELENEFSLGRSEVSVSGSVGEKLLLVAQEPEFLLHYEPEGLSLELPFHRVVDEETGETAWDLNGIGHIALTLTIAAGLGLAAFQAGGLPYERLGLLAGPIAVAVRFTKAHAGSAYIHPAIGHTEDAVATAMYYENEVDEYHSLEAALEKIVEERNSEDEVLATIEELDDENVVNRAYDYDSGATGYVDGTPESETRTAGGDD
jgi:hypothetical protein